MTSQELYTAAVTAITSDAAKSEYGFQYPRLDPNRIVSDAGCYEQLSHVSAFVTDFQEQISELLGTSKVVADFGEGPDGPEEIVEFPDGSLYQISSGDSMEIARLPDCCFE